MADEEKKEDESDPEHKIENQKPNDTWSWSEHKRMWIMFIAAGGMMLTAIAAWVITKP